MSDSTSPLTLSTISSPVTQTGTFTVPPTSSSTSSNSTSSTTPYNPNANPFPSPNPAQNPNPDPFSNGPSVYLYGFLATLVLIFLVSICVAWRGYRARRLLRARIDEAISRGVYIPGYTGDDYPTYGRGVRARLPMLPQPTVYEDWIDIKSEGGTDKKVVPGWDIKPTAIAAILPYVPPSTTNVPLSNATSLLHQLLDPLREYWFVRAPDGAEPGQVQGLANRGSRAATVDSPNPAPANNEEKEIDLTDAEGLSVAVLIAMPNPSQPSIEAYGKGKRVSRPSSYQHGAGVASTSQLRQSVSLDGGVVEEQVKEDLPELMMGVAEVGIQIPKEPTPEPRTGEGNIGGRSISVPTETNPKVVSPNPLERIKSNSMPQ